MKTANIEKNKVIDNNYKKNWNETKMRKNAEKEKSQTKI